MNEETRRILLSQFMKKKAFRDRRRFSYPSSLDVIHLMAIGYAGSRTESVCPYGCAARASDGSGQYAAHSADIV